MQYIVVARDQPEALNRRMTVRADHLELGDKMIAEGTLLYAAAMTDENGNLCGSMMVVDFPTREALDDWLSQEPYVVNNVWQKPEVIPAKVGPSFMK